MSARGHDTVFAADRDVCDVSHHHNPGRFVTHADGVHDLLRGGVEEAEGIAAGLRDQSQRAAFPPRDRCGPGACGDEGSGGWGVAGGDHLDRIARGCGDEERAGVDGRHGRHGRVGVVEEGVFVEGVRADVQCDFKLAAAQGPFSRDIGCETGVVDHRGGGTIGAGHHLGCAGRTGAEVGDVVVAGEEHGLADRKDHRRPRRWGGGLAGVSGVVGVVGGAVRGVVRGGCGGARRHVVAVGLATAGGESGQDADQDGGEDEATRRRTGTHGGLRMARLYHPLGGLGRENAPAQPIPH